MKFDWLGYWLSLQKLHDELLINKKDDMAKPLRIGPRKHIKTPNWILKSSRMDMFVEIVRRRKQPLLLRNKPL